MKQVTEAEMLHRAAAYCSTAERCVQEVEKKILSSGLPREAAERIIARLLQEKFIDEVRYSRSFSNDKLRFNKWGRVRIGYELRRKNIPDSLIREAMGGIDEEEYESVLFGLLKEKKKTLRGGNERENYYKLLRFAAGRGFESEIVSRCLRQTYSYEEDMGDYTEDWE